jgi:DNA-binding CsgD family transcriptional regulator
MTQSQKIALRLSEIRKRLFSEQDFGWDVDRLCELAAAAAESVLSGGQLRVVRGMLEGKTDAEIARAEGMARGSVRRLRSEAVRALRGVLGGQSGS